jgi:ribonuclease P protein component
MIPQVYRLKISKTQPFVGRKWRGSWVALITKPFPSPQWAVRIGKHIFAKAVDRNRLRRQLNHYLYRRYEHLIPQQCLVILLRSPQKESDLTLLKTELETQLINQA